MMNNKRHLALLLILALLLGLTACGSTNAGSDDEVDPVTITLDIYPLDENGNRTAIDALLYDFRQAYPYVTINVNLLTGDTASSDLSIAIESGDCPDLLLGSLSQLQHAQRRGGMAVDLSDIWNSGTYTAVKSACTDATGLLYALPAVMDVTCMAINYEMFQASGALEYVDMENHSWTTEGFINAVKALKAADFAPDVLALYCGGQNGDAATRALVTNLYGGTFTDEAHKTYTLNSEENINALTTLQGLSGVIFDKNIVAEDENILFQKQQLAMSLYWNAECQQPENFTAIPMAYPSESGRAEMPGEVWGFSCFDNGDESRLEISKALLSYLTDPAGVYSDLAAFCGHYPVYPASDEADDFAAFMPLMGRYDLYTPGFAVARTEWYELLQRLGGGADVALEVETFCTNANAAAKAVD